MRAALGLVIGSFVLMTLLAAVILTGVFLVFMPKVAGAAGGFLLSMLRVDAGARRQYGVGVASQPAVAVGRQPRGLAWRDIVYGVFKAC
jgi:hypothetical protein